MSWGADAPASPHGSATSVRKTWTFAAASASFETIWSSLWPKPFVSWQPGIVHFHSVHIPRNVALAAHLSHGRDSILRDGTRRIVSAPPCGDVD